MGLSSKQVSKDVLDWGKTLVHTPTMSTFEVTKTFPTKRQYQQQSQEVLKCPRCGSTNTKFCYYNNYNKSQPRHFCKACKRHWTKGGTLRNVPVGGGRKNKRLKTTTPTTTTAAVATTSSSMITSTANNNNNNIQMPIQTDHQQHCQNQRSISQFLCQAMMRPPFSSLQQDYSTINSGISSCSNNIFNIEKNSSDNKNDGVFLGGSSLPLNPQFPFSSSGSFGSDPSLNSTCFQSSKEPYDDYIGGNDQQPWQVPTTSILMDMPSYLSNNNSTTTTTWDDFDTFVSPDLNSTWDDDDSDIKPY